MNSKSIAGPNLAWVLRRGLPKAEVFWPSASLAKGLRPKLLAEGLGHIFGKSFYSGLHRNSPFVQFTL